MSADKDAWAQRIAALDAISLVTLRQEIMDGKAYWDKSNPHHHGQVAAMPMIAARLSQLEGQSTPVVPLTAAEQEAITRKTERDELSTLGHQQAVAGNTDFALAASDTLRRMDKEDASAIEATTNLAELKKNWAEESTTRETELREGWVQGEYERQTKGGMRGREAKDVRADAEALYDKHHTPEPAASA